MANYYTSGFKIPLGIQKAKSTEYETISCEGRWYDCCIGSCVCFFICDFCSGRFHREIIERVAIMITEEKLKTYGYICLECKFKYEDHLYSPDIKEPDC